MALDFRYPFELDADPLAAGIRAAVEEQPEAARWQLWEAVTREPLDEMAWSWLAKVAESEEEESHCLRRLAELDSSRSGAGRGPEKKARLLGRARRSRPRAAGVCGLCLRPWVEPPRICPRCRCLLDLAEPEIFLGPPEQTNLRVLKAALRRLKNEAGQGQDRHRILALAHLNLGELGEALAYLEAVVEDDPEDREAKAAADVLRRSLDGIPAESGFETEIIERPTPEDLGLV